MPQKPSVLMIGFGYVANHTVARLIEAGWQVQATTRSAQKVPAIKAAGAEPVLTDLSTQAGQVALRKAVQCADALVASVPPSDGSDPVLSHLDAGGLSGKRLIYLSTTGVYGDRQGGWAFEREAPTPGQARSIHRANAEAQWLALGALALRLGGIYGPGRSPVDRLKNADGQVLDKPGQVFSRIHVNDIAQAIVLGLEKSHIGGAINLVDDRPCSQVEVLTGAAALADLPAPTVTPFSEEGLSPMAASFWAENRRVSNARAKALLGWRPRFPSWREGLTDILAGQS